MTIAKRAYDSDLAFGTPRTETRMRVIAWDDPSFLSVALHARSGGIGCDFAGTPEQARELGVALIAAADALATVEVDA